MLVNDELVVEIVTPGTDEPAAPGKVGEVVVTRLQGDYPLLRFATGDLSAWASSGRLKGWMGRADQSAKVKGLFVHPGQIVEIGKRHPELGALRLVVRREGEQDAMTLHAETASANEALSQAVAATLQALTRLRGEVALVALASLPERRQDHRRRKARAVRRLLQTWSSRRFVERGWWWTQSPQNRSAAAQTPC